MAEPRSIWIVVLNWNGISDTLACVRSLQQLRYPLSRIVVVDNGSTDGSVALLRSRAADGSIELVESSVNLGYAGGNNLGIRHALERGADFVLVLNNDTTVDPMLLDELVGAADRHPEGGCFGPWILYMHDPERLWFASASWSTEKLMFGFPGKNRMTSEISSEVAGTDYVCGAALFFPAAIARRIGLLDELFFLVYEDSDWCYRVRRAGFECITVPSAHVWHKVGTSFGSEASPLRTYFSVRNRLLWGKKNLPRGDSRRMLFGAISGLLPTLHVDRSSEQPAHKALVWAIRGYLREWQRKQRDPQQVARRRAVIDYVLHRFGDCPPRIRELSRAWSSTKEGSATASRVGT